MLVELLGRLYTSITITTGIFIEIQADFRGVILVVRIIIIVL